MDQPGMNQIALPWNFHSLAGPPLISLMMNWGLLGLLSTQVFVYYQACQRDRAFIKVLVYTVYVLEAVQTLIYSSIAWGYYIDGFGDWTALTPIGIIWLPVFLIGGLVALLVQTFYAYRIYVLSESKAVLISILLMSYVFRRHCETVLTSCSEWKLACVSLAGALAVAGVSVRADANPSLSNVHEHFKFVPALMGVWEGAASLCDVVIAVCMTYYLKRMSRGGSVKKTQQFVSRVVRLTIETGTLTATVSILALVLYYSFDRRRPYYSVPVSVTAKLYSNMLMAALNSRVTFRIVSEDTMWRDVELSRMMDPALDAAHREGEEIGGLQLKFFVASSTVGSVRSMESSIDISSQSCVTRDV